MIVLTEKRAVCFHILAIVCVPSVLLLCGSLESYWNQGRLSQCSVRLRCRHTNRTAMQMETVMRAECAKAENCIDFSATSLSTPPLCAIVAA